MFFNRGREKNDGEAVAATPLPLDFLVPPGGVVGTWLGYAGRPVTVGMVTVGPVTGHRETGLNATMPVLRPGHDSVAEVCAVVFGASAGECWA